VKSSAPAPSLLTSTATSRRCPVRSAVSTETGSTEAAGGAVVRTTITLESGDAFPNSSRARIATKYSVSGARPRIDPPSGLPAARGTGAATRIAAENAAASIGMVE
jgi:hypothetical protein